MQQTVALHRLRSNQDGPRRVHSLLSHRQAGADHPRYLQIFIWQTPVMLLNVSIVLFIIGLSILVYHDVSRESGDIKVRLDP